MNGLFFSGVLLIGVGYRRGIVVGGGECLPGMVGIAHEFDDYRLGDYLAVLKYAETKVVGVITRVEIEVFVGYGEIAVDGVGILFGSECGGSAGNFLI